MVEWVLEEDIVVPKDSLSLVVMELRMRLSCTSISARLTPLALTCALKFSIRCFQGFDISNELDSLQIDSKDDEKGKDDSLGWLLLIEELLIGWVTGIYAIDMMDFLPKQNNDVVPVFLTTDQMGDK